MISVTKKAAEQFKEHVKKVEDPENKMLRVTFNGFGWGGPDFGLTLEESKGENDIVAETEGMKVVYDREFGYYLDDAELDYNDHEYGSGFILTGKKLSSC
jgi:iron-sulfur cluster assembly protein